MILTDKQQKIYNSCKYETKSLKQIARDCDYASEDCIRQTVFVMHEKGLLKRELGGYSAVRFNDERP